MWNFINPPFSPWEDRFGLESCPVSELSGSSQGHNASRHKGDSSLGYYLYLLAVVLLFKFVCLLIYFIRN